MRAVVTDEKELTVEQCQRHQPWTVPYSDEFRKVAQDDRCQYGQPMHHLFGSHACLHAMKSLGKVASIFESLDHTGGAMRDADRAVVADMAADLFTIAMRLANLYGFSLVNSLRRRVNEKNGVDLLQVAASEKP